MDEDSDQHEEEKELSVMSISLGRHAVPKGTDGEVGNILLVGKRVWLITVVVPPQKPYLPRLRLESLQSAVLLTTCCRPPSFNQNFDILPVRDR